jgi:DNA-binding PadR family transcriptional regulator
MSPVFGHGRLRLYLLKLLDEAPRHGYEVIRLLQDRFMGVYAPSPGTIYPRLARLEEEGLLTHDDEDGRKIYRITDKGREEINRRLDELDELEREITESVSGIAREVKEDVRETVRSLREELTWATRDVHRETGRSVHDQARQKRDEARERARRVREELRQAPSEATSRAREEDRHDTGREREGRPREGWGAGRGWGGPAGFEDWPSWTNWSGRRRRPGSGSEFENLAKEFGNELRRVIRQAGALSEGALDELRQILEDALERMRSEVFGPLKRQDETGSGSESAPGDHPASESAPGDSAASGGAPGDSAASDSAPCEPRADRARHDATAAGESSGGTGPGPQDTGNSPGPGAVI